MNVFIVDACGANPIHFLDRNDAINYCITTVESSGYFANVYQDGNQVAGVRSNDDGSIWITESRVVTQVERAQLARLVSATCADEIPSLVSDE